MQPTPKILVVVESIDIEESSGSKANWALIQNLQKAGYDLKVYHYSRKKVEILGIQSVSIKEERKSLLFFLSRIERFMRYYLKVKLYKPLENIFGFSFTLFNDRNSIISELRSINDFTPDLVITLSKGGSFRPHHALLKIPEWHSRWLAYMHDPYPMHHYPKPYTWHEPGFQKKEKFIRLVSQKAAFSGFPSQLLKEWMGKFYPGFLNTGVVIPHQILKQPISNDFPDYFDPEIFNVLHAGNLLGARNPRFLLEAYLMFLKEFPEAEQNSRLIFLGGNNERVIAGSRKYKNILASKKYVSFDQVFKMQQKASVNIILEARSEISPFLPGKFPHCVSADKPILLLGPEKSEVRRLLGLDYPYWSEITDAIRISKLIGELYTSWKDLKEDFKLNRPDIEAYLGEEYLKEVIDQILVKAK